VGGEGKVWERGWMQYVLLCTVGARCRLLLLFMLCMSEDLCAKFVMQVYFFGKKEVEV